MRIVVQQGDVFVAKVKQAFDARIKAERGQGSKVATQLKANLVRMIGINMGVAKAVDEVADLKTKVLRHHVQQQGIGGNVERDPQENVRGTLVELARKPAIGHVELKEGVAGRERHLVKVAGIPGRDDVPATVGVAADALEHVAELVHRAVRAGPKAPLKAINGTQIAPLGEAMRAANSFMSVPS